MEKKENKFLQLILIIGLPLIFTVVMFVIIQNLMTVEEVNIYNNTAEQYYYEGNYDAAIEEYKSMQSNDPWPIWSVKKAKVYAVKGDYKKAVATLKEAVILRNKLLEEDSETYKDKDPSFMNEVISIFYMINEKEEAISLAEDYISKNSTYRPLIRTMFAIYLENGDKQKAETLATSYPIEEGSVNDIVEKANMNMVLNNYDDGFRLLKDAWNIDKNDMRILDVVRENSLANQSGIVKFLRELSNNNPNEDIYKLWLAEAYVCNNQKGAVVTSIISNGNEEELGQLALNAVKAEYYINIGDKNLAKKYITELINDEKSSYIGYYLQGVDNYKRKDYDKALLSAKKSILANRNFSQVNGSLMPNILLMKSQVPSMLPYLVYAYFNDLSNFNILSNIANYYKSVALNDEMADRYYDMALNINPYADQLQYQQALIDIENGDIDAAIEKIDKAIDINDTKVEYYRTLGTIYLKNEQYDEAIDNIRKAFELDENDVLTLNNAGCYYILSKENVWRGYENLKAAYEGMPEDLDDSYKTIITRNYDKAEKLYSLLVEAEENDETIEYDMPLLELFN